VNEPSQKTLSSWGPPKGSFVTYTSRRDFTRDTALITKVHPDGSVNLTVFADGNLLFKKDITEGSGRGQWKWS